MRTRERDWSWPGSVTDSLNNPRGGIGNSADRPSADSAKRPCRTRRPPYSRCPTDVHSTSTPVSGRTSRRTRMKLTPRTALVVLVAAIALMATAGAGATAALMITGKQIKDSSVTSQDIKNNSLKVKDLSARAQAKLKGRTGATGAAGARGP